jgi:hypothetical protein
MCFLNSLCAHDSLNSAQQALPDAFRGKGVVHACAVCLRAAITALLQAGVDAAMAPLLCAGKHS